MKHLWTNVKLRLFTLARVPLVAWLRPVIEELSDERALLRIPLSRRARNHVRSMYVGALCTGAETTAGLMALRLVLERRLPVTVVITALDCQFLRLANADILFSCDQGATISGLVDKALKDNKRHYEQVTLLAHKADAPGEDPVASFTCTLTARQRRPR